jgi:hypothetical protein
LACFTTIEMRFQTPHTRAVHTRDAALGKLTRINRVLIADSVTLTGVLADVAAHAFPGRALHTHTDHDQNRKRPASLKSTVGHGIGDLIQSRLTNRRLPRNRLPLSQGVLTRARDRQPTASLPR